MTTKINGAAYPGVWVERQVAFIKITFDHDISQLAESHLVLLGTTTAVLSNNAGTVASSTFGVVESAIVKALKTVETTATVLGVSSYDVSAKSVDVMVGFAEGWFSDTNGLIATGLPVTGATAVVTTAGSAPTNAALGQLVSVADGMVTFKLEFAAFDGNMTVATGANGGVVAITDGVGAGTAAAPMGAAGYYPAIALSQA